LKIRPLAVVVSNYLPSLVISIAMNTKQKEVTAKPESSHRYRRQAVHPTKSDQARFTLCEADQSWEKRGLAGSRNEIRVDGFAVHGREIDLDAVVLCRLHNVPGVRHGHAQSAREFEW
jgi:hypothetical protein